MRQEDFIFNLTTKFKDKKDEDRNKLFGEDLGTFCNKCMEIHLQDVYNWISINHQYSTPFNLFKIYDYAKKKHYLKEGEKRERKEKTWLTCVKCGTHYSVIGRGCPNCREKHATIFQADQYPENYIRVYEDCYYCTIYPEIKKHEKWITYVDCGDYGKKQDKMCKNCQCLQCCTQMKEYYLDPRGTIEKYRTGELAQPWLMHVDPLNETVRQMVKDIARRRNARTIGKSGL